MTEMPQQNDAEPTPLTIVVTGAAGFIGRRVVSRLAAQGMKVCAVDRVPRPADLPEGVDYQCADLSENFPPLPSEFILVHLAWNMDRSDPAAQAASVSGFSRLLGTKGLLGVVGMGSAEEYGELEGCLSEEMAPGTTLSAYGLAKHEACHALNIWTHTVGCRAIWLRPFIVYGPGQNGSMLIPYAVRCAQQRQSADFSAGLQYRDFVHVDDVADGIAQAALRVAGDGVPFLACNVGGGKPVQVREVLERIAQQLDAQEFFHLGARPMREGEPKEQFAAVTSARSILGWTAQTPWEEGIDSLCKETF
jgi:nucleoside-diphosphate-sugar epimerase